MLVDAVLALAARTNDRIAVTAAKIFTAPLAQRALEHEICYFTHGLHVFVCSLVES